MKRSPHALHKANAVNRSRRRRLIIKGLRQRLSARREVFFNQENAKD